MHVSDRSCERYAIARCQPSQHVGCHSGRSCGSRHGSRCFHVGRLALRLRRRTQIKEGASIISYQVHTNSYGCRRDGAHMVVIPPSQTEGRPTHTCGHARAHARPPAERVPVNGRESTPFRSCTEYFAPCGHVRLSGTCSFNFHSISPKPISRKPLFHMHWVSPATFDPAKRNRVPL